MSKATYKRAERVADQIKMEVADILMRRIKDPRVHDVTVTDVDLTGDLRTAYVYVTSMKTGEEERHIFAGLSNASGFVRAELGKRLSLRYLPDVIFKKDVSGPRGDRIMQLLEGLHRQTEQPELPDADTQTGTATATMNSEQHEDTKNHNRTS